MWWLIIIALAMGLAGLAAFLWSLRNGQYDDLDGAAERVLLEEDPDVTGEDRQETRQSPPLRSALADGGEGGTARRKRLR
nr:cbb3-type cytochrome oxidase assembly protein CcoS [Microvirga lupini]